MKTVLTTVCLFLVGSSSIASSDSPAKVEGVGYVEPASEIRNLSFQVGGVIAACQVEVGQQVKKGTSLLTLANDEEIAQVRVAEAGLRVAEAERARVVHGINEHRIEAARREVEARQARLTFLEREFRRVEDLRSGETVSESLHDETKSQLLQGQADLLKAQAEVDHLTQFVLEEDKVLADHKVLLAQAQIELMKTRLEETVLRAPMDGTILEILQREGERVDLLTRTPVMLFADLSQRRVRAEIDERHVHALREGQRATIYGRNLGGAVFEGKVTLVKQLMGPKTVFTRAASERKDLDVLQILIDMDQTFSAPAGLRVDVRVHSGD
jgi:multidrug resistance efflux pump